MQLGGAAAGLFCSSLDVLHPVLLQHFGGAGGMSALLEADSEVILRACKFWRHQWQHSLQFCSHRSWFLPICPPACSSPHPLTADARAGQKHHIPCDWAQLPQSRAVARPRLSVPTNTARGVTSREIPVPIFRGQLGPSRSSAEWGQGRAEPACCQCWLPCSSEQPCSC